MSDSEAYGVLLTSSGLRLQGHGAHTMMTTSCKTQASTRDTLETRAILLDALLPAKIW